MANRRWLQALTCQATTFLFTNLNPSLHSLSVPPLPNPSLKTSTFLPIFTRPAFAFAQWPQVCYFSSNKQSKDDTDGQEEDEEEWKSCDDENVPVSSGKRVYTEEEKEAEALAIGYQVVEPLHKDDGFLSPTSLFSLLYRLGCTSLKKSNNSW